MELILYTNINYLRDVLGGNAIVCRAACDKERTASVGIVASTKLFLTHKKLEKDLRFKDLDNSRNDGEVPVQIKLEVLDSYKEKIPVLLVKTASDALIPGTLADYDKKDCEGCFWGPFIPVFYVKEILFETKEDEKLVFKPSPDLWYPESLYSVINDADYTETIDYDMVKGLIEEKEEDTDDARKSVVGFEKQRAILYYAFMLTQEWIIGKYKFNVDPYIINRLGLDANNIAESLHVNCEDLVPSDYSDKETLCSNGFVSELNKLLMDYFLETDITTEFDSAKYQELSDVIKQKVETFKASEQESAYVCSAIEQIKDNIYSPKGIPFTEMLKKIDAIPPLKALACVLKYPHDFEKIKGTAEQYGIGQEASRLAAMYFAAIHGMEFLEGIEKNNLLLERRIDEAILAGTSEPVYSEDEYKTIFGKDVADLCRPLLFISEKIVAIEDIYDYFSSHKEQIAVNKIRKNYGNKIEWDKYLKYIVPDDYKPGDVLTRKQAEDLGKRIATPVEEASLFIEEYFDSIESFNKLYEIKPDFWKSYYKDSQKKK